MNSKFSLIVTISLLVGAVAIANARILSPPPGARGTIDFRYPDWVVDPRLKCTSEGVFPHPRNCTWYYRCYDRYGFGFYWTAYFECEPGTVFSDALDQCIFGSVNENCTTDIHGGYPMPGGGGYPMPGGGGYPGPGPAVPAPPTVPVTVRPTVPTTNPQTGPVTIPGPIGTNPSDSCTQVTEQCANQPICPRSAPVTMYVYQVSVCNVAEKRCDDGSVTPICPAGTIYAEAKGDCIEKTSLCQDSERPATPPPVVCEDIVSSCQDYYVCPNVPTVPELVRRCDIQQICTRGGVELSRKSICPGGYFDAYENSCSAMPSSQFDGCDPSIIPKYPLPDEPNCYTNSELCSVEAICNSEEMALVCKQFFSCEKTYARVTRNEISPPAPSCVEVEPAACDVVTEDCTVTSFCPTSYTSSLFVSSARVCRTAMKSCSNGEMTEICAAGEVYDSDNSECRSEEDICSPTVRPETAIVCEDIIDKCEDIFICPNVPEIAEQVRRCDLTRVCKRGEEEISRDSICEDGQHFDVFENACIPKEDSSSCSPDANIGSPSVPMCSPQTESCVNQPICGSIEQALLCVKVFSCDIQAARRIAFVRNTYPSTEPKCMEIAEPVTCDDLDTKVCSSRSLCPETIETTTFIPSVMYCPDAVKICTDQIETPACEKGFSFVKGISSCISESDFCSPPEPRPTGVTICEDFNEGCNDVQICDGANDPIVRRLCDITRVCLTANGELLSRTSICPGGKYDTLSNQCVPEITPDLICDAAVATPLPEPICTMLDETCQEKPVCNSTESIVSCHHAYSCTPDNLIMRARQSTSKRDSSCELMVGTTCGDVEVADCRSISLCPPDANYESSMFIPKVQVCESAVKRCSDGSSENVCDAGQAYSPEMSTCVPESVYCKLDERAPSSIVCVDEVANCQDSYNCPSSSIEPEVLRRCDMSRVCTKDGVEVSRSLVCEGGKFDTLLNQCADDSSGPYECSPEITNTPLPPLECEVSHEICEQTPVCETNLTALSCRHLFSCSGASSPVSSNRFKSRVESQRDTKCAIIESLVPPTCEEQTSGCQYFASCPPTFSESQFTPTVKLCTTAEMACSDGSKTVYCQPGELYEESTQKCVLETSLCKPPEARPPSDLVCEDEFTDCEDVFYCNAADPNKVERVRLCDSYRVCSNKGETYSRTSLCEGKFDAFSNRCVENTPTSGDGCSPTAVIPTAAEAPVCQDVTELCEQQDVCDSETNEKVLVCKKLYYCLGPNVFYLREDVPRQTAPCIKGPHVIIVGDPYEMSCSYEGEIPMNDMISKYYCHDEFLCSRAGQFRGKVRVCSDYFECKMEDNFLTPTKVQCPPGEVLKHEDLTCVNLMTDTTIPCTAVGTVGDDTGTPDETIDPNSFYVTSNVTLNCTYDGETPIVWELRRINCYNQTLCDATTNVYQGLQEICDKHYVCETNFDTSEYVLKEGTCASGEVFGYVQDTCYTPSQDLCSRSSPFYLERKIPSKRN